MSEKYAPDIPESIGVQNALRRAQQLAQLRWTPVKPFPAIVSSGIDGTDTHKVFLKEWRPQTGANYAAVGFQNEKYVGVNVSLETFMTALSNPNSVLYTRPQHGRNRLTAAYYGTVCSEFVSYVMDLPFHIDCPQWPCLEGITKVNPEPLENLKLCDILNEAKTHTALITGIERDSSGKVTSITVTESTPPQVISTTFRPQEFIGYWLERGYEVLRYDKVHAVTYAPDPWVHLEGDPDTEMPVPNPVLMPDFGNKANYRLGETVTLSVFDSRYTHILLQRAEDAPVTLLVPADGNVTVCPDAPGYYRAFAVNADEQSQPVEFCVTEASVTTDRTIYASGETVRVSFSCPSGDELVGWMVKTATDAKYRGYLRAEDGSLSDTALLPAGDYYIIAHYRNRYGVYTATPTPVFHIASE